MNLEGWVGLVFVKPAALVLLAAVADLAHKRASAAWRHAVWTAVVVGLLALPVLSALLPQWPLVVLARRDVSPAEVGSRRGGATAESGLRVSAVSILILALTQEGIISSGGP